MPHSFHAIFSSTNETIRKKRAALVADVYAKFISKYERDHLHILNKLKFILVINHWTRTHCNTAKNNCHTAKSCSGWTRRGATRKKSLGQICKHKWNVARVYLLISVGNHTKSIMKCTFKASFIGCGVAFSYIICLKPMYVWWPRFSKISLSFAHCRCIQSENMQRNSKRTIISLVNVLHALNGWPAAQCEKSKCEMAQHSHSHAQTVTFIKMFNVMCMWLQFN